MVDVGGANEVVVGQAVDGVRPEFDCHVAIPFDVQVGVVAVGFGDFAPQTTLGRGFTILYVLASMGLLVRDGERVKNSPAAQMFLSRTTDYDFGDYLRYQKDFYDSALEEARRARVSTWIVSANGDQARLHAFGDLLNRHRIRTHRLARDVELEGRNFRAEESLVIPVAQPQYRLIRSLFETLTEFEDATFYDVSTWTLPPAFGLDYAASLDPTSKSTDWRRFLYFNAGLIWAPDPRAFAATMADRDLDAFASRPQHGNQFGSQAASSG